ncbi:phosphoglycerate mutase-like protein [Xylariaceae sp. FL1019]|nr:phosphoglycerate mutase-like protein [Xylariaceae sp. FL1019]
MAEQSMFAYQAIPGFFECDEAPAGPDFRATTTPGLGLIDRTYGTDAEFDPMGDKTQWERFEYYLASLNKQGDGKVKYKLIYYIRHGEGFHNVKEHQVGTVVWDDHWSRLDGDGVVEWFDAFLTDTGKQQAQALNDFWRHSTRDLKIPLPQEYYSSPHARCLETTRIAYSGLEQPADRVFKPVVKEMLRERTGEHTCDKRRTRSWIAENYPDFRIEEGFTQEDEIWKADYRETADDAKIRVIKLLNDVFSNSDKSIVSFTAHSSLVHGLHAAIGHRDIFLHPGAMIPLLVRATTL